MAGHNKWSQIKRKKAANDAARGKIISKHVRAIQTAVRTGGGGDPDTNVTLRNAVSAARTDDVTADVIERAIERAAGGTEGGDFEEVVYEGYGPAGVAIVVEALTDNRNRTAAEVRHVFSKYGGNMSGSTAWQFDSRGVIVLPDASEDMQELVIELGALDLEVDEDGLTVYTEPTELYSVLEGIQKEGGQPSVSQLTKLPQTPVELDSADSEKIIRILDAFEELDDVQNVYSTASFSEETPV